MKKNFLSLYDKNHIIKNDERFGLFNEINKKYNIKKVLYSGSYTHITPIFIFPLVIFNDIYKKLQDFYASEEIKNYINKRKIYSDQPIYSYICADYNKSLPVKINEFDLLKSQYSRFISRACRYYLKKGDYYWLIIVMKMQVWLLFYQIINLLEL